jgi:hypothetical protein
MKTKLLLLPLATAAALHAAPPQQPASPKSPPPPVPPPLYLAPAPQVVVTQPVYVYEQKPITSLPTLVSPQQAQSIIEKFKAGYAKLGSPRILIYVNRDLVDDKSGTRLTGRDERVERTTTRIDSTLQPGANAANPGNVTVNAGGNVSVSGGSQVISGPGKITASTQKSSGDYSYRSGTAHEPTLADKQTVRDIERLFGRPLRMGGASLADQRVTTQLIPDQPLKQFTLQGESEQARKDRAALAKVADVVVEVLVSSRSLVIQEISGDKVYNVPDIQVTAIQLKDSKIMGQASASDILGKDRYAGRIVTNFDVREITEAVALALMEDMMLGVK